MPRCWECDAEVDRTVEVRLPLAAHGDTVIRLCQPCLQGYFLPLVVENGDEVARARSAASARNRNYL